jgi:hypothetical protein
MLNDRLPKRRKLVRYIRRAAEGRNPQDDKESKEGTVAFNLESYDASNSYEIDECVIYYDWLTDSAMTTHITNQQDAFINYKPLKDAVVQGIGDLTTCTEGKGTVELESEVNGNKYKIYSTTGQYPIYSQ